LCQFHIVNNEGTIFSNTVNGLNKNDCSWLFTTLPGHRIQLTFSKFIVDDKYNCEQNYVQIYDGPNNTSQLLGKYCNTNYPGRAIESNGNQIILYFKTNMTTNNERQFVLLHETVCGGNLIAKAETQQIYSHANYGKSKYNSKETCVWTLKARFGKCIKIWFETFQLEKQSGAECYDSVQIFDGPSDHDRSFGSYCGTTLSTTLPLDEQDPDSTPSLFISTRNSAFIRFETDSSEQDDGFIANYAEISCTKVVNDDWQHYSLQRTRIK
ncbi:unnamed protein product, partial [Didymodactylos carnosus]